MPKVTVADNQDDFEEGIQIRTGGELGLFKKSMDINHDSDPFSLSGDDLSRLTGISHNFRRKMNREIQKAATSASGNAGNTSLNSSFGNMSMGSAPLANPSKGKDNSQSKKLEPVEVTAYALFNVVVPTYNLDYLAKVYEINSSHFAAVQSKISNVVGLGYDLLETPKVTAKLDEIPDENVTQIQNFRRKVSRSKQQVLDLINTLNNDDSLLETLKRVYLDYEVTGNGYIEVGRTATGAIGYVGHIPSTTMRIRRKRDGFVQIVNYRTMFFRNFGDKETPDQIGDDPMPNEVIHLKKYTPTSFYYGIPDVIPATNAVAGDQFASKFNIDYFENKAVPRYIITVKGAKLNADSERKLLEFFQTGLKGSNHRTLYIPLPADEGNSKVEFKMDPVEAGVQDSSFHQYRQDNKLEILMAHRVPLTKVSIMPGISLANARDADKTFREQVTRPIQEDIEYKVNKIISEFTDMFELKFNELTLTDEDTQSKIDERYLRMKVITPNDVRIRKGMVPMDGGDIPVELTSQQNAEVNAQTTRNRRRDQERSANSPDLSGEGRNSKGDGRQAQ
jgi:PBSX family phage portal protein